ncbi:sigma-70 family RNA polymerase sigma factor [Amycolatopsis thermalba]|uniref:Sigma-70 family RNA polymerase sigma factor n=1 Tax=Amycolatopsis thermalba TaxID=944492 RepID=A0ABY4NWE4_9PSEU|nr:MULTISPECIES: sigma-70 family RNA polymerase sigma factor [Amycolatopsis]UQS24381.1 sigma-70 family RNA polymerase sigma factor [Amycolatopsis thermalba]
MAGDTDVDADLIEAVRAGDLLAYDRLFRRHLPAARRVASMMWRDRSEVDDLVAESFLRVLVAIRDGAGPAERFRPYLLVTLRNLAMDWGRRRERCDPWTATRDEGAPGVEEIVIDRLTGEVARSAFETLPPRWRYVLWHTEMLGTRPATLAGELGMTANGVAALAVRAREGLRQAFLQAHVPAAGVEDCRTVRRRLGAWTRGKVTARQGRAVSAHLADCPKCHRVADVLETVNGGLPVLALVPLFGRLLGGGAPTASVAAGGGVISKMAAAVTLAAVAVAGPAVVPDRSAPPQVLAAPAASRPAEPVPDGATPEAREENRTGPARDTAARGSTAPDKGAAKGNSGEKRTGAVKDDGAVKGNGAARDNGVAKGNSAAQGNSAARGNSAAKSAPGRAKATAPKSPKARKSPEPKPPPEKAQGPSPK